MHKIGKLISNWETNDGERTHTNRKPMISETEQNLSSENKDKTSKNDFNEC